MPTRPRTLNVVILSDGLTEPGDAQTLLHLIKSRPANSRVFSIGVGNDVNKPLLENIADESGGLAAFLCRGDNFARQAEAFRRKLMRPVASDLKIDFGNVQVYDVEPKQLPNLYHGAPVRLYGRYKDGGAGQVTLDRQDRRRAARDQPSPWTCPSRTRPTPRSSGCGPGIKVQPPAQGRRRHRLAIGRDRRSRAARRGVFHRHRIHVVHRAGERRGVSALAHRAAQCAAHRPRSQSQAVLREKLEKMRNEATDALGPAAVQPVQLAILPDSQLNAPANSTPGAGTPSAAPQETGHSADVPTSTDGGSSSGGGAMDPFTAAMALAIAGLAWFASTSRKRAA